MDKGLSICLYTSGWKQLCRINLFLKTQQEVESRRLSTVSSSYASCRVSICRKSTNFKMWTGILPFMLNCELSVIWTLFMRITYSFSWIVCRFLKLNKPFFWFVVHSLDLNNPFPQSFKCRITMQENKFIFIGLGLYSTESGTCSYKLMTIDCLMFFRG